MWGGLTNLESTLWTINILGNLAILVLLVWRGHYKDFRLFTAYILFSNLRSAALLVTQHSPEAYFYVYYSALAISASLLFFVVLAIAYEVFAPYKTIPLSAVIRLIGSVLTLTVLSLAASQFFGFHPEQRYWDAILTVDKFSKFACLSALGLTTYMARELSLPWERRLKGLSAGLAFMLLVQGIAAIHALHFQQAAYSRPVHMVAYLITASVWLWVFRRKRPELRVLTPRQLEEIDLQIKAFRRLLHSVST